MLRCRKLRLAGDGKAPRCWPFGTYVALRIPGGSKSFHPFEQRGCLGRLLWQDAGSRLCYAISPTGEMIKGFAAAPVLSQEEPDGVGVEQVANLEDAGWRKVALEDGATAWFHEKDGVLSLICPCLVEVAETSVFPADVADADTATVERDVQVQTAEEERFHECERKVHFRVPEVESIMHFSVKNITVKTADRAKSLRARRHPELDVSADVSMVDGASGELDLGSPAQACLVEASIRQLPEKVEEMA
eukprot:4117336-Amphidinium_carterae.1